MHQFGFHPLVERWFLGRFEAPTEPQQQGWPPISAGEHTLIAAPTGSGKTLTAFLAVIDRLLKDAIAGQLEDGMRVVYISPLRALSNDMHRNLTEPLAELNALAAEEFPDVPIAEIRAGLRTGDTTASQRAALVRRPPHILVTTPESLFLLLTAEKGRAALRTTDTIIIDEIHALIRDKRGSHLALSVERLEALCERRLQRIGLSATQKPIERVGCFLTGGNSLDSSGVPVSGALVSGRTGSEAVRTELPVIVDVGHRRDLDLAIEVPPSELSAVCSMEQWGEINARLVELITTHSATLIFVNTRRMAERVTHQLTELLGEDQVGSHHGSLSTKIRLRTEQQLKDGQLKAVVATASLELGLDVGCIDLVIQIGSPRAIATFLQRIGRSGHSLGKTPRGRLFALTRDELIECMALVRAVRAGRLDVVPIPENAIDVLAQQIVGEVACREWDTDELLALFRRAWPYRQLSRDDFFETLRFLSEGLSDRSGRSRVYLHHDRVRKRVRARPGARIAAASNAGAIPEVAEFRVVAQPDNVVVGTLDEDFAIESHAGQIVLLGNTSWRMEGVRGTDVLVSDAGGAPPTIPFWRGEAPGRTIELSEEVARLREDVETALKALPETVIAESWKQSDGSRPVGDQSGGKQHDGERSDAGPPGGETSGSGESGCGESGCGESECGESGVSDLVARLCRETSCSRHAARQVVDYVAAQIAAVGVVPTQKRVMFERFFDETGGMQMVVHAPFGSRITHAWGLAMRKRFCVSFDFELQATADDEGFILSLGPQHSFPLESMFPMLNERNVRELLQQAILYIPMFQIRWRWNMNRALLVPRRDKGKRIPPNLQRFRSDDLLTSVFPMLTGCQENISGPLELPDHILLRQTMEDCLHEALDIDGLEEVLARVGSGEIEFVARDTREPSPFSYELLNSNPYAFLDGGELPERRARAVATRRSLSVESVSDLGRLDPLAIEQVVRDAQPAVRSADELHDLLLTRLLVREDELLPETSLSATEALSAAEVEERRGWLAELATQRRAARVTVTVPGSPDGTAESETVFRVPAERLPAIRALFPGADPDPSIEVPDGVRRDWNNVEARVAAVRGLLEICGPITHVEAAARVGLSPEQTMSCLEALEGEGLVLRGTFRPAADGTEWCHRRLLARIHRLTLEGLRKQIQPVPVETFFRFLIRHHGLTRDVQRAGVNGLFETVSMLQGMDIPAAAWERDILPARVAGYRSELLDELCLEGEVAWGRLFPPKRESEARSGVRRVVPVSIFLRSDQDWLTAASPLDGEIRLTASAQAAVELLRTSGATFATDLQRRLGLTGGTFQDVLGELISAGLLTADGFGGLRGLLADRGSTTLSLSRRRGLTRRRTGSGSAGRWSLWRPSFTDTQPPADSQLPAARQSSGQIPSCEHTPSCGDAQAGDSRRPEPVPHDPVSHSTVPHGEGAADGNAAIAFAIPSELSHGDVVEQWAWQLLRRWGVVFRELRDRESGAPRWWELLQVYRRLEARGELRGGRFISGVAGEQFALPDTVKRLRELRDDSSPSGEAADRSLRASARLRNSFLASLSTGSAATATAVTASDVPPAAPMERSAPPSADVPLSGEVPSSAEEKTSETPSVDGASADDARTDWLILSAADPLNLVGVITEHARVPAFAHNRIAFYGGRPVAALVNQEVVLLERLSLALRDRAAMLLGRLETGICSPDPDAGGIRSGTAESAGRASGHPVSESPAPGQPASGKRGTGKFKRPAIR